MVPSLGQGALALQNLTPTELPEEPLNAFAARERSKVRTAIAEILGDDPAAT
jgi:hypothetical protein